MALFGFLNNYSKPGPGVSKEDEEKSVWAKFFIVYQRRLSKFVQLNLIFMIPLALAIAAAVGIFIAPSVHIMLQADLFGASYNINVWLTFVVTLPFFLLAPFWGGIMVVARRLSKEEYAFIWSEYWKGVKDNWKQFLANGVINYIAYILFSVSLLYYNTELSNSWFYVIPFSLVLLLTIVFYFAQYYVGLLIVSVNLSLRHIYKNALIFAMMGLLRNLLMTFIFLLVAGGVVLLLMFDLILYLVAFVIVVFFAFSFFAYANSYICYPLILKFIIEPYENKLNPKTEVVKEKSEEEFLKDIRDKVEKEEDNQPKYVYVNGRLIRKEYDETNESEEVFVDRA